ncbi:replicative DNA helicase [Candidatus Giovannonibacteria bacterium RIFCSPLOWO2_01_FULL_44_40]|uniref:Replicative DNA helicase n=1 Tax=Candidatus Giovannonibacteria bacterium RIFCSPHIGHO2_01_FULL_45_23 TaxID=1798325 RepID=A0A1F5VE86_9BACT|nr:MAG: replicative DNA helicase [Candidatus Giovannonibacteria bacterium RIFCSPHIGHO2_01_FULL_45_23]OGF75270.1 MAG: replicative DNA helicase [Candidatus Giovannonibacteria bacterium RIFCSPHIGHO2_02_FULL_45_13]OGF79945.1 MAG: replicative DNA helicase [Candidatus Giovannonibacteria bacterium RIFCSPLOWO2_01_FULL_44_40]
MAQVLSPFTVSRMPPQNIEAEISLLGSLLLDGAVIDRVVDIVGRDDFYKREHQAIFDAASALFQKQKPIDVLTVGDQLKEHGKLEEIGGVGYLTTLVNSVPTASNAAYYAEIIRKKKILRDLITISHEISQMGYQESEDVGLLMDEAEKRIFSISQRSLIKGFEPVAGALEEAWERIDRLHKGAGALRGIPTGFKQLDNKLSGLQESDLVVLAARPSLGKTALAMDIARHVSLYENIPVGIFSLEMSRGQLVDRLIAAEANVDAWRLRTGQLSPDSDDFERIRDAMDKLSKAPLFIDDEASINILQMRAKARRLQAEKGLGLIIVDYLQLMVPRIQSDSMVQQITEISRSLKALARELKIPVLALSQLNRAVESRPNKKPQLSDLRESGAIEQDADVVMFIYREDLVKENSDRKNQADILIQKHRNGPTGEVVLYFNSDKISFSALEKDHEL